MFLNNLQKILGTLPRLELPFAIVMVFSYIFLTEFGVAELPSTDTEQLFSIEST